MRVVFADTGYWEALLNPRDNLQQRAVGASKALGKVRIVTTEMVLSELLAPLSNRSVRPLAVQGVDSIRQNPNVEVLCRKRRCSSRVTGGPLVRPEPIVIAADRAENPA